MWALFVQAVYLGFSLCTMHHTSNGDHIAEVTFKTTVEQEFVNFKDIF